MRSLVAGKGLMNRRLEAAHVFHGCALPIPRLQILVQNSNYFIIQNLELANSFNHFLQRLQTSKKKSKIKIHNIQTGISCGDKKERKKAQNADLTTHSTVMKVSVPLLTL